MNKYVFEDYFHEPEEKIAKRMLFKSDNVIAFVLNIAKGEILPGHTHMDSTLFLQVMKWIFRQSEPCGPEYRFQPIRT